MPIDIDSDKWEGGSYIDWLRIEVVNRLRRNDDKAYSVAEITEHLEDNNSIVFPEFVERNDQAQNKFRQSLVFDRLQDLLFEDWVDVKVIDGTHYFTKKSGAPHIAAQVRYEIPDRLDDLEEEIDERPERLEERLRWLEHRVGEAHGY
ncbi:hypothetical protein [Halorubrum lipolyticum]|uniref:hypothetical protein n=1 Tax=Halorubrum lipolyticum TaxID=368624 RepID=UPI0011CC4F16|nr:hypothetical protein [Halorubrum lipolyticum]